jgi:hypothetical protein
VRLPDAGMVEKMQDENLIDPARVLEDAARAQASILLDFAHLVFGVELIDRQ